MHGAIDSAVLAHPIEIFRSGVIPSRRQFAQGDFVRRLAVNFVRGHENEHRFRGHLPAGLEQIDRANRVHIKIRERNLFGFVMGRLGSAMDDQVEALLFEELQHFWPIPDVHLAMNEALGGLAQPFGDR